MKKLSVILFLLVPVLGFGQTQNLPASVVSSFKAIFPGATLTSWTGNDKYNYLTDWTNDAYFGDFNYDGFPDNYSDDGAYYDDMGDAPYYYNDDLEYNYYVPDDYQVVIHTPPTQYQLNFRFKGLKMAGIFKADGSFVIAKGRVSVLPEVVVNTIKKTFKGKVIRLEHVKELMMTPNYLPSDPVYRVKVFVRHNGYAMLKIDSNGKVVSNNQY